MRCLPSDNTKAFTRIGSSILSVSWKPFKIVNIGSPYLGEMSEVAKPALNWPAMTLGVVMLNITPINIIEEYNNLLFIIKYYNFI